VDGSNIDDERTGGDGVGEACGDRSASFDLIGAMSSCNISVRTWHFGGRNFELITETICFVNLQFFPSKNWFEICLRDEVR
jgi:hypothetical protein